MRVFRLMCGIACHFDLEMKQMDAGCRQRPSQRQPITGIQYHRTVNISIQLSRPLPITDSSSDRVYSNLRELKPAAVEGRRKRARVHRGALITPGPNYAWSIDAYCKMERWGIQMYAAIDVFSRHIMWTFVGISGRSQTSVFVQYCEAVRAYGVVPKLLRADRGAETVMAADAHVRLSGAIRQGEDGGRLQFEDCFRYGTSKQNQRIEAWWAQQSRSQTARWRDCFAELTHDGSYSRGSLADRIAFAMIYIPIMRTELDQYAELWNIHQIRKQPDRPYLKTGIPCLLFHCPTVKQKGVQSGYDVPPELLDAMDQYAGDCGLSAMRVEAFDFYHGALKTLLCHLTENDGVENTRTFIRQRLVRRIRGTTTPRS